MRKDMNGGSALVGTMTIGKLLAFTAVIYLGGCAAAPQSTVAPASFAPAGMTAPASPAPKIVTTDSFSWEVAAGPAPQTLVLTPKVQVAAAGDAQQTPPTDEQVKKAAEQALPPGCKIEEIKNTTTGETQVKFTC